jgi:hypothetical protein
MAIDLEWEERGPGKFWYVSNVIDHGVKDSYGRHVGNYATISIERDGWAVRVWSTRDGKTFGPWAPMATLIEGSLQDAHLSAVKSISKVRVRLQAASVEGVYLTAAEAKRTLTSGADPVRMGS